MTSPSRPTSFKGTAASPPALMTGFRSVFLRGPHPFCWRADVCALARKPSPERRRKASNSYSPDKQPQCAAKVRGSHCDLRAVGIGGSSPPVWYRETERPAADVETFDQDSGKVRRPSARN